MSIQDIQIPEDAKFKRARFQNYIIAVGGKNGECDKVVMKNLAEDEHSHMTLKVLPNGGIDLHLKNELTSKYEPLDWQLVLKYMGVAFRDFWNFIEQFDPSYGRFARLPAILIRPPMFEAVMKGRELIMNLKEVHVLLGSVSLITEPDIIIGFVDDWKAGEQYMIFRKEGHSYRMPMLAFAKHAIKCLKEAVEFTNSEKALMRLDQYDQLESIPSKLVRNVKRIFYFVQPLYYRIMYR